MRRQLHNSLYDSCDSLPEGEVAVFLLLEVCLEAGEEEDPPVVHADGFVISLPSL